MSSTSCSLLNNAREFEKTSKDFIESAIDEDYDRCVQMFALERPEASGINIDTLKKGVANFRKTVMDELGDDIEYKFLSAVKSYSTSEKKINDVTEVRIEISNSEKFDEVVVIFDDRSKKIFNIKTLNLNKPIPSMAGFWLFGILCLCVPAFNIYMIIRIRQSDRRYKWLKILSLFILNLPTIGYQAATGSVLKTLYLQIFLGFSFALNGYQNSKWELGVPLAGLYWLWRLNAKPKTVMMKIDDGTEENVRIGGPLDSMS